MSFNGIVSVVSMRETKTTFNPKTDDFQFIMGNNKNYYLKSKLENN